MLFVALATAAVAALAVLMRRRAGPALDYDAYAPLDDFDSELDGSASFDEDDFSLRREDFYSQFSTRTYN